MRMNIALFGAPTNNLNMGCMALTYSIVKLLCEIADANHHDLKIYVFEDHPNDDCARIIEDVLNIGKGTVEAHQVGMARDAKNFIRNIDKNISMLSILRKCDFAIDVTQGDSFTDIYGMARYQTQTNIKRLVQMFKIPLILGPQTYGPFQDSSVRVKAKKVIEKAVKVISRDQESKDYLSEFCDKPVTVATDLAFGLPYSKDETNHDKIRVGINPSGLLVKSKTERTDLKTGLTTDYDTYIQKLINALIADERYEVHLIPHVGDDAVKQYSEIPKVIAHQAFKTPIEAKNCIASMDVFVGARMHATIGAFSAGVATIPTAYSRKFSGLFKNIGYDHVLDLTVLETDDALKQTLDMIDSYKSLQKEVGQCMVTIQEKLEVLKSSLSETIEECLNSK